MLGLDKVWDFLSGEALAWGAGILAFVGLGCSWIKGKTDLASTNHEMPKEKPILVSANNRQDESPVIDNGLNDLGKHKAPNSQQR